MKLNAGHLAIALGGTAAILWIICSALVALFPGAMLEMTGHTLHLDATAFVWTLTIPGFIIGLCTWTISAAVTGWLIGVLYNATAGSRPTV